MKLLNPNLNLDLFFQSIKQGSVLILDFDGTLAPFVKNRMESRLYPGVQDRLDQVSQNPKHHVIIISGRSLMDLRVVLKNSARMELWGSHGLERQDKDGQITVWHLDTATKAALEEGIRICKAHAQPEYTEVKPFSVALHVRGMNPAEAEQVIQSVEKEWRDILPSSLDIQSFDGGLELRPVIRNKGSAVSEILMDVPRDVPIAYLGDDYTDEDAFEILGNRGLKVLVRPQLRPTLADLHLVAPEELLLFLDHWRNDGT